MPDNVTRSVTRGVPYDFHPAGTSALGNGQAYAIPESFKYHQVTIETSAGVASGAVTIETAPTPDYAGTWDTVVAAITVPAASTVEVYNFIGIYRALRARISTVVAGGTITVSGVSS